MKDDEAMTLMSEKTGQAIERSAPSVDHAPRHHVQQYTTVRPPPAAEGRQASALTSKAAYLRSALRTQGRRQTTTTTLINGRHTRHHANADALVLMHATPIHSYSARVGWAPPIDRSVAPSSEHTREETGTSEKAAAAAGHYSMAATSAQAQLS